MHGTRTRLATRCHLERQPSAHARSRAPDASVRKARIGTRCAGDLRAFAWKDRKRRIQTARSIRYAELRYKQHAIDIVAGRPGGHPPACLHIARARSDLRPQSPTKPAFVRGGVAPFVGDGHQADGRTLRHGEGCRQSPGDGTQRGRCSLPERCVGRRALPLRTHIHRTTRGGKGRRTSGNAGEAGRRAYGRPLGHGTNAIQGARRRGSLAHRPRENARGFRRQANLPLGHVLGASLRIRHLGFGITRFAPSWSRHTQRAGTGTKPQPPWHRPIDHHGRWTSASRPAHGGSTRVGLRTTGGQERYAQRPSGAFRLANRDVP